MKNIKKTKNELAKSSVEDLKKKLLGLRDSLRLSKWKSEGSKSKNVREERALRRDLARVLTILNSKK